MAEKPLRIFQFGGMVRDVNPYLANPNNPVLIVNMVADSEGLLSQRDGTTAFLNAPAATANLSLIKFYKPDGTRFLFMQQGTKLYKYSGSGSTWTECKTGLTAVKLRGVALAGKMFFTNGTDTVFYTADGTTFTDVAAAPKGLYACEYQNRVFVSGVSGAPNRNYYSRTVDGTDWTVDIYDPSAGGFFDCSPDYKGQPYALVNAFNRMTTFKENGIWAYDMDSNNPVLSANGTTYPDAICETDRGYTFLTTSGLYLYRGSAPVALDIPIRSVINSVSTPTNGVPAAFFDHKYIAFVGDLTIDDLTISNCCIVFDEIRQDFYIWSFPWAITSMERYATTSGAAEKLYLGTSTGQVYSMDKTTVVTGDAGTAVSYIVRFAPIHYGFPERKKDFARMHIFTNPGTGAQVMYKTDDMTGYESLMDCKDFINSASLGPRGAGKVLLYPAIMHSSTSLFEVRGLVVTATVKEEI